MLFPVFPTVCSAHDYFFAFAEIDYNPTVRHFEITLEGSAHDVEDVMNATGIPVKELEDHYTDAAMLTRIETFINEGFTLSADGRPLRIKLTGMEVNASGMVYFYLCSEETGAPKKLDIRFDWLMDTLPQQQNKATLRFNDQKYTAVFLPGKRTETLEF
jgi:hypothetical protein